MNKHILMVIQLAMSLVLLFFGMAFYLVGRELYGPDAALIWVGGFLSYIAVRGVAEFLIYLSKLNDVEYTEGEKE